MPEDSQLLQEHALNASDEAFAELFSRHGGMVYGVALRMCRDYGLAEDVTQAVFIILARKAPHLNSRTVLAGWLYRTARLVSLEALRSERRRQQREQSAAVMSDSELSDDTALWSQLEPLLDNALARLGTADRDAVVLRFLEQRSFSEVAATLGTSEAAAKMRVGRALEKLRNIFAKLGVTIPTVAVLTTLLASNCSSASPVNSTSQVNSTSSQLATRALKRMAVPKLTLAIGGVVALLLVSTIITMMLRSRAAALSERGFTPMAGQWNGTFTSFSDADRNKVARPVTLNIRVTGEGRRCEIEMKFDGAVGPNSELHFSHELNEAKNRITTFDDPQIGRLFGEGSVTEAYDRPLRGEWKASVRAKNPGGKVECSWSIANSELTIVRHDEIKTPVGATQLSSELKLRRVTAQ